MMEKAVVTSAAKMPVPSFMPDWLVENPMFTAGFGLFGLGAAMAILRRGAGLGFNLAKKQFLTTLEIPSRDYSYQWVMQWLVSRCQNTRHLSVETTYTKDSTGHVKTAFDYIPSPGTHWMRFRETWLVVERERAQNAMDSTIGTPFETLTLTTFAWNRGIFGDILAEARDKALTKEEGKTIIYNPSGQEWRQFGLPKRIRPIESVVLDDGVSESLLSDVLDFQRRMPWYMERGIPYRRGYLLWGPPGCGKSSFAMALAGALKYNICVLNVSDATLTDERLHNLLAAVPPRSLVLLEDIDGAVSPDEAAEALAAAAAAAAAGTSSAAAAGIRSSTTSLDANALPPPAGGDGGATAASAAAGWDKRVSFSGLLNALDGVAATEERIVIMTTNKRRLLPPALVRPGRVDVEVYVGLASLAQKRRMFLRFFPGDDARAAAFAAAIAAAPLSTAALQGFFVRHKDDPQRALDAAPALAAAAAAAAGGGGAAPTAIAAGGEKGKGDGGR